MTWHQLIDAACRGEDHLVYSGDHLVPVKPCSSIYTLKELRETLGYEMVEIAVRGDGWLMVVDEEGRLKPETVVNPIATRIYRHALGLPSEELPSDGTPRMRSVGNAYVVEVPEAGHEPNEIVGAALICAAWRVR